MGLIEDQNPLRTQIKQELDESKWMQKFKALSEMLQRLKAEIPITHQCDLRWDTAHDWLTVSCPDIDVRDRLIHQTDQIASLAHPAQQVIVKLTNHQDVIISTRDLSQP